MEIFINKLKEQDAEELFKFECNNRTFFEQTVPSRGDDYYIFETFKNRHRELLKEQAENISYFYLIKNGSGSIVGRINLVAIDNTNGVAYVGYRIGEKYTQRGIANKALKQLLNTASESRVNHIQAKTTSNNIASQKVLEKNGFTRICINEEKNDLSGQKETFIHYSRSL
ncbi:GNAT family N-acetyltransferase [Peribacillus sp. NPDC076916]|uniref:GNAT family N-acetyltransferase n=1 Tax=Peribacillus sp. NPDC076916 TaxID=3390608 RepID=UPI003D031C2A